MQIHDLNNDCLERIFAYLSLNDQLSLDCVCQRWNCLMDSIHLKKTTLKLFGSVDHLQQYTTNQKYFYALKSCHHFGLTSNDILVVSNIDLLTSRTLVLKFPNLKMLFIYGCTVSTRNLEFILSQLNPTLLCLSLIECFQNVICKQLWHCINSLARLEHLALFAVTDSIKELAMYHLKEFYFGGTYQFSFASILVNLGKELVKLALFDSDLPHQCLELMTNANGTISKNLTHLSVKCAADTPLEDEKRIWSSIAFYLQSLSFLDIFTENGIKNRDLGFLSHLKSLSELRIRAAQGCDLTLSDFDSEQCSYQQFPSVSILHLEIDFEPNTFEQLHFIFPVVEKFTVDLSRVCCLCVDKPEIINEIQPGAENVAALPNPNVPEQPQPLPPPAGNMPENNDSLIDEIKYEEDNCEICCQKIVQNLASYWNRLSYLSVIGERCKDSAIKALKEFSPRLRFVSFAACNKYYLNVLVDVCYQVANQRKADEHICLKISKNKFERIIKLPNKPRNLSIANVDPVITFDT